MRDAGLPVTLIIVGSACLLWYYRLFPDIDWIIAAGLVVGGVAVLYLDGITKKHVDEIDEMLKHKEAELIEV